MTDIVDRLRHYAVGMGTRKPTDYMAFLTVDEATKAADTIEELRTALHRIGFDYIELSHDKVQLLYLEHMHIARHAYQNSFPKNMDTKPSDSSFDDNF